MKKLLKKYFGYDQFRPLQEEIINNVVNKKDTFVLMPTGGGKSLCFQLPALKFSGITLVISPLIALMKDQVDNLKKNGISADFLNSTQSEKEQNEIGQKLKNNETKLLYVAPERLALPGFQEFLKTLNINLIAIDEAHCISEWGHDFRPDYRNLKILKNIFPGTPIIALTATATPRVQEDIVGQLSLQKAKIFISSFNRENLNISIINKEKAFNKLTNLLAEYKNKSVIIYCFSRNDTEKITEKLNKLGFNALPYHAGLNAEIRKKNQNMFIKDSINIMVATIAFGMGIDKPDVRLVVHYTFPKTLEGYYQEIGRAGRDGLPSECVMFYTYADTRKHEFFIDKMEDIKLKVRAREKLNEVINYAKLTTCRKRYLLKYFGEELKETNCCSCDVCMPDKKIANFNIAAHRTDKEDLDYNRELFEKLRALRKKLANEMNVPPFVVFADTALIEMSHYLPLNNRDFSGISGVGAKKLEQFGDTFLAVINNFVKENNLSSIDVPNKTVEKFRARKYMSKFYVRTKELIDQKMPIEMIAKNQGLVYSTIINHIETMIDADEKLNLDYLKPPVEKFNTIKDAFEKCGDERLKPVFEYLKEKYSYEEIRLVRILMRTSTNL